ncbi:MAG: TetR/AcrR family transcriptional regulator [Gammaproteobacteria bacterium]
MISRATRAAGKLGKKTLDRDAWLKKALDVLFANGISQIKIEVLARKLKLTKGSFYWHFKNRDDLLRSMVDWWRDNQLRFITGLKQEIDDPASMIRAVIDFTQHTDDSSHDIAMREFARFNRYAARAVAEVDERRVAYLAGLFRAARFSDAEADLRARALYFYQVGEYTTSLPVAPELRDDLAERRFKLLICRPLDE